MSVKQNRAYDEASKILQDGGVSCSTCKWYDCDFDACGSFCTYHDIDVDKDDWCSSWSDLERVVARAGKTSTCHQS